MSQITLDPYVPLALWVPLTLIAAALLAGYALAVRDRLAGWRRWAVPALMSASVAVPLLILLNPTWLRRAPPPPGKPLLTVLVDSSASMAVRDAEGGRSRYREACAVAKAACGGLADRYDVTLRAFAADSSLTTPRALDANSADGNATDLAAALDRALDDERPQGQAVLLLSDGIDNVGGSSRFRQTLARAKTLGAPIYTKTLGGPCGVRDLEVGLKRPQEVAFIRQPLPVTVTLRQRGALAARVGLRLLLEGKEIEERTAKLLADGTTEEVFQVVQDKAGLFRYEVRADVLPGEVSAANNVAPFLLRVVDQPVRVLLLEGKPYWDTKFLIRTLSLDESIELTAVVQLAAGRLLQRNIARKAAPEAWTVEKDAAKFLADSAALASYQIVILGRGAEVFLSDEALVRLRKWLNDVDGSLVCFRGAPSSEINQRLDELLPVRWTPSPELRFHMRLSDEGQSLGWLPGGAEGDPLAAMPSLAVAPLAEAKPYAAPVLALSAAGDGRPVPAVTYRPVGAMGSGRVVVVEGSGMWRWAFLPPQYQKRDDLYGTLWRSLVRWLVTDVGLLPSQRLSLRADKAVFTSGEIASATLLVRENRWSGGVLRLEVSGPALARPQTVACRPWGTAPGQYHAELGRLPEGRYRIRVEHAEKGETSAEAALDVRGNLKERLDVTARPVLMKWIAQSSGGEALSSADAATLARLFETHLLRSRPERIIRAPAWDRWWVLAAAFVLWGVSWGLRRRSGLI